MTYITDEIKIKLIDILQDETNKHFHTLNNIIDDIKNKPFEDVIRVTIDYDEDDGISFDEDNITLEMWIYEDKMHEIIDNTDVDLDNNYVSISIQYYYTNKNKYLKDKEKMIDLLFKYKTIELKFDENNLNYWQKQYKKHFKKNLRKQKINKLSKK